jgi:hypothetical protein
MNWTAPYYGVSHLYALKDRRRATVSDLGTCAELTYWFLGCGFYPAQSVFANVEAAKLAGERWIETGETAPAHFSEVAP